MVHKNRASAWGSGCSRRTCSYTSTAPKTKAENPFSLCYGFTNAVAKAAQTCAGICTQQQQHERSTQSWIFLIWIWIWIAVFTLHTNPIRFLTSLLGITFLWSNRWWNLMCIYMMPRDFLIPQLSVKGCSHKAW